MKGRITVLHGVNFDVLGRRPATHYGGLTLKALELQIKRYADELGFAVVCTQTNHERSTAGAPQFDRRGPDPQPGRVDALFVGDPRRARGGALPAVEVHLSTVDEREEWRRVSVIRDLCIGAVQARGPRVPRRARAAAGAPGRVSARTTRWPSCLRERELDCLLVSKLVNVRYLTGFTGTNGACVVARDERLFLTDSRYIEQAKQQVPDFELLEASRELLGDLAARLRGPRRLRRRVLERDGHRLLAEERARGCRARRRPVGSWRAYEQSRTTAELAAMRAATALADAAYEQLREAASPAAPSARWRAGSRGSWRTTAPTRSRSRRSSPAAATGAAARRSRDVEIRARHAGGGGPGRTAGRLPAPTARARWPRARWPSAPLAAYEAVRSAQAAALEEAAPGRSAGRSTPHAREASRSSSGSASTTASATGSGSRCTRGRGWPPPPTASSRPATW